MKKIFLLITTALSLTACEQLLGPLGCGYPSLAKQAAAENYLNQWDTFPDPNISEAEAEKIFGCLYARGDRIYSVKTLWATRYILVRYGKALTYVEK